MNCNIDTSIQQQHEPISTTHKNGISSGSDADGTIITNSTYGTPTTTTSDDDDDIASTTSSDEALCEVLGLPSLSGMVTMTIDDDENEDEDPMPIMAGSYHDSSRPALVPRKIKLPSTRGVSRKYHSSNDCFAYEIPDVLSLHECSKLIKVAANSSISTSNNQNNKNGDDKNNADSFRYITHAVHTAPDGKTKFEVKLERPNPHKLAVFRHDLWVNLLWDRLLPLFVVETNHHQLPSQEKEETKTIIDKNNTIAETKKNKEQMTTDEINKTDNDDVRMKANNNHSPLQKAFESFIQRESLMAAVGLNPRLRVLKYDAPDNDEFLGHFDATTEIHALGQTSYLTVLLYLNDGGGIDFDGGETEFLSQQQNSNNDKPTHSEKNTVRITPKAGSVVLFEHDLFHRGRPLLWGTKYVLRTDVMFENPPESSVKQFFQEEEETAKPSSLQQSLLPSSTANDDDDNNNNDDNLSTVENILSNIEFSDIDNGEDGLLLLRNALSEGLGLGDDLHGTTIECLCSPGRFALNLMLRDLMMRPGSSSVCLEHQQIINRFLNTSFEALKERLKA